MRKVYLLIILLFTITQIEFGQASIPATNWVEISFDATLSSVNNGIFNGSGFQSTPLNGQLDSDAWIVTGLSDGDLVFGGSGITGDFARGSSTGSVGTGGIYSFEVSTGNYTLGIQPTADDWTPGTWTLKAINNSGITTTKVNISYDIWIYNNADRANSLSFSYSTDNVTYYNISSLDYTTTELVVTPIVWEKITRNTSITIAVLNNDPIYFRWTGNDVSGGGSRDEYSIDNIRISIDNEPLPVELTSFTAISTTKGVMLNWSTATEVNNYGFDVERKSGIDNREWEKISFVEGHGNSNSPKDYSFVDNSLVTGEVSYRLKQIDTDGAFEYSDVVTITSTNLAKYELYQNHPNPFNPSTTISFSLAELAHVKINVYNAIGQKVVELANGQMDAGSHSVNFNASSLSTGFYFYRIETPNYSKTMKMMLIK